MGCIFIGGQNASADSRGVHCLLGSDPDFGSPDRLPRVRGACDRLPQACENNVSSHVILQQVGHSHLYLYHFKNCNAHNTKFTTKKTF